jgi:hypothetical protein
MMRDDWHEMVRESEAKPKTFEFELGMELLFFQGEWAVILGLF